MLLSDGDLSEEDYASATQLVVECIADRGGDVEAEPRYGTYVFSSSEPDGIDHLDACDSGDIGEIRALYEARYRDPHMRGEVVLVECLADEGVIEEGGLPAGETVDTVIDAVLEDGQPGEAERVDACLYDPYGWQR